MNARSIRNRLLRVERKTRPPDDVGFTLEELCRCMWREDNRLYALDGSPRLNSRT
jgi:hypothetical protein